MRWITPLVKQTHLLGNSTEVADHSTELLKRLCHNYYNIDEIWVVASILISMLGHGMVVGITSFMAPALQAPDSPIKVDLEQLSWISGSVGIGVIVVLLGTTYIIAIFGRRQGTLIGLVPAIIGPLFCYFSSDINVLIFGRFLSGMGKGTGYVGAVVIGEFTSPQYRGVFLNLKSTVLYFGSTLVHVLGYYFHWRTVMLTISFMYSVSFIMTYTWPESPAWFVSQKKYNECTKSFYWLRGKSEQSTRELEAMITAQKELAYEVDRTFQKDVMLFLKKFTKKNFLKPLWIYLFVAILLETTGRHVFSAYAFKIMYQMDSDPSKAFYYTLGIDLLMSISAIISTILVKIMKRRNLLFYSGVPSAIILLAVCLYYFLQSMSLISQKYDSVSIFLFGLNFGVVNLGCTPICLTLIGELFPLEHRPTSVSVGGILISIFMTLTLQITPLMLDTLKMYGTFAVYGIFMSICLLVLYFILPETKDKTLQEIEEYFSDSIKENDITRNEEQASLTVENPIKVPRTFYSLHLKDAY